MVDDNNRIEVKEGAAATASAVSGPIVAALLVLLSAPPTLLAVLGTHNVVALFRWTLVNWQSQYVASAVFLATTTWRGVVAWRRRQLAKKAAHDPRNGGIVIKSTDK